MVTLSFEHKDLFVESLAYVEMTIGELQIIARAMTFYAQSSCDISLQERRDACEMALFAIDDLQKIREERVIDRERVLS